MGSRDVSRLDGNLSVSPLYVVTSSVGIMLPTAILSRFRFCFPVIARQCPPCQRKKRRMSCSASIDAKMLASAWMQEEVEQPHLRPFLGTALERTKK